MGAIYRPEDARKRRMIDKALEDLDPNLRESARRLVENYSGEDLEKKLAELIGFEKTRKLIYK